MQLRMGTEADAPAVRAIYAPVVESTPTSFELAVPSVAEMAARIADRLPTYPWLVAEVAGSVAGYAYADRFNERAAYDWSVTSSVYVDAEARGNGVGKGLYVALFEILSAQGYRQAMAGITLPNDASVGLHERVGFSLVGIYRAVGWKLGAWHDVGWWQRGLGTGGGPPGPPLPLAELREGVLERAFAAGGGEG